MGAAVNDSNLHAKQASGLEFRRHIEVSRDWQWDRHSGGGEKRSRRRTCKIQEQRAMHLCFGDAYVGTRG